MPSFDFHFDQETYNLRHERNDESVVRHGNEVMQSRVNDYSVREPNTTGIFNDLPFYLALQRQKGCIQVDLVQVIVRRNSYILGLQSMYRCTWKDGTTTKMEGPWHDFEAGPYANSQDAGEAHVQSFALEQPGECLLDVVAREGAILDALVFISNRRIKHIGGFGGFDNRSCHVVQKRTLSSAHKPSTSSSSSSRRTRQRRRIVAFAGTYRGVMHRIGYYAKYENRDVLVLLRRLCEQGRAIPIVQQQETESLLFFQNWFMNMYTKFVASKSSCRRGNKDDDTIMHRVVARPEQLLPGDGETGIPESVFEEILEYL